MMRIALFEPWGLGDLAVALCAARRVSSKVKIVLLCAPPFVEWAKSLSFIETVVPIRAPWTAKSGKYNPLRYSVAELLRLRGHLRSLKIDQAIDLRGDLRHRLFLPALGIKKALSPSPDAFVNRYERVEWLAQTLKAEPIHLPENPASADIACFFGAEWPNRRVPIDKARELIAPLCGLVCGLGRKVSIILQPDETPEIWKHELKQYSGLEIWQGTIAQIADKLKGVGTCISTDSAWLHVAAFQGAATVGLFGFDCSKEWSPPGCQVINTDPLHPAFWRYRPRGAELRPLETLSIEKVLKAIST